MAKITFILGLSGSGKSYVLNELISDERVHPFDEGFTPLTGELFCKQYLEVLKILRKGEDCGIVEISLCREDIRNLILLMLNRDVPEVKIRWICIRNNKEQANKNVKWRASNGSKTDVSGHLAINEEYSKLYTYPKGCEFRETFDPSAS